MDDPIYTLSNPYNGIFTNIRVISSMTLGANASLNFGSKLTFTNGPISAVVGLALSDNNIITGSLSGALCLLNSGRRIVLSSSPSFPAITINTDNTSTFYGRITVSDGTDPRFQSLTTNGEILVGTATNNSGFFPSTTAGDGCIRSSKNLFLGPLNSGTHDIYLNNQVFKFNQSTWSPTVAVVSDVGVQASTITYNYQHGYFSRVGNLVTVFFDVGFSISRPAGSPTMGFMSIGSLPVRIGVQQTPGDLQSSSMLTSGSFPNGLAGDLVPAIGVPVYSGGYSITAFESGFQTPLFVNAVASISYGNWTATGFDLLLYARCEVFTPAATVPPWSSISSTITPLSTFHVGTVTTFNGCRFAGSISYLSDY